MIDPHLLLDVQRALQEGLPLVARPYLALADELGVEEPEVIDALIFRSEHIFRIQ